MRDKPKRVKTLSSPPQKLLPSALGIDEFKGNTNKENNQCILTDLINNTVFDILPNRSKSHLINYLFKAATTAFHNWGKCIVNSVVYKYSNGITEGVNNKIKVLKRNAHGYRNFDNLRTRIILNCT